MRRVQTMFVQVVALGMLACAGEVGPTGLTTSTSGSALLDNLEGTSASYSTQGPINTSNEFHTPQGTNGRSCGTCHLASDGWSITPQTANQLFNQTGGLHPLFNIIDANTPDLRRLDRRGAPAVLQHAAAGEVPPPAHAARHPRVRRDRRQRSLRLRHHRAAALLPPAPAHRELQEPHGDVGRRQHRGDQPARRPHQAGPGQRHRRPAGEPRARRGHLRHGRLRAERCLARADHCCGVGSLDAGGAQGGPEAHASQPLVDGAVRSVRCLDRHPQPRAGPDRARPGAVQQRQRPAAGAAAAATTPPTTVRTSTARSSTSAPRVPSTRRPDMAVYTLQNRTTGEIVQTTDWGRGLGAPDSGATSIASRPPTCAAWPRGRPTSTTASPAASTR